MGGASETPSAVLQTSHVNSFFFFPPPPSVLLHTLQQLPSFLLLLAATSALQGVGMANKGPSYGLSRQVQDKIDSKYDPDLEQILVEWISRQCGSGVGKPEAGKLGFQAWLKDGCVCVTRPPRHSLTPCAFTLLHTLLPFSMSWPPGSEPTHQQSACRRQTSEEDPELRHGLQTDGADLPVPLRC